MQKCLLQIAKNLSALKGANGSNRYLLRNLNQGTCYRFFEPEAHHNSGNLGPHNFSPLLLRVEVRVSFEDFQKGLELFFLRAAGISSPLQKGDLWEVWMPAGSLLALSCSQCLPYQLGCIVLEDGLGLLQFSSAVPQALLWKSLWTVWVIEMNGKVHNCLSYSIKTCAGLTAVVILYFKFSYTISRTRALLFKNSLM